MKRSEKIRRDFERLCKVLTECRDFRRKGADFRELCSSLETGRVDLENTMYELVGMSGDDVLTGLRRKKARISY